MLMTGRSIIASFPARLLYCSKYGRVDILVEGNEENIFLFHQYTLLTPTSVWNLDAPSRSDGLETFSSASFFP